MQLICCLTVFHFVLILDDNRKRKKRDWASISVEQFMAEDFSDRSDEEDGEQTADVTAKKKKTSKKNKRFVSTPLFYITM